MTKQLCLLHANCHGETLMHGLNLCPEFARRYDVTLVTNYTREAIPEDVLRRCGLFLYQYLMDKWGELASERLVQRLPSGTPHLCIPNPFFRACWPFWRQGDDMDHADTMLDTFLDRGLTAEEAATLYLLSPLHRHADLDALIAGAIAREHERQKFTPVPYVEYMLANFREVQLFHTPNHPTAPLMAHCINGILHELGLPQLTPDRLIRVRDVHPEFELPIHPQVAKKLSLKYCDANTRWNIYGTPMLFNEYVSLYLDSKMGKGSQAAHKQSDSTGSR